MAVMKPRTLILRTAGTNCDAELAHAFELSGAVAETMHLNRLIESPEVLDGYDLMGLPGGFSYGDDIAAGRIFANRIRHRLYGALRGFIAAGKPLIGVCNGFQVLVRAGLLPAFELPLDSPPPQVATLADNAQARFIDRWVPVRADPRSICVWTRGLDAFDLPIAHGEGRFVAPEDVLNRLESQGQIALRYAENPNGSMRDIAGVCDPTGLVLGLMPHPERFTHVTQHPTWTRKIVEPAGLRFFQNAVEHVATASPATA
jgi:phosphoribosylformylglycinamidine synthase subunit PurQ / glutaminase